MDLRNDINNIVCNNFCIGCGACVSICPKKAISIAIDKKSGVYLPSIDKKKCINCGLCKKICPAVKFEIENNSIKEKYSYYIGTAKSKNIIKNSSSGGCVTSLLLYLLEKKEIEAVLLVKNKGLVPEFFLAKNKKEIISAMGSKYCPVPLCMGISDILESNFKKIAVVGLPCEIQAFRNIENINEKLREKIFIHIGLFCSRLPSYKSQKYLLQNILKIDPSLVKEIKYRIRKFAKIKLINKKSKVIEYEKYWNTDFKYLFNEGCLFCYDRVNDFSDISFGDYWPENKNIIILRNKKFKKIIEENKNWQIKSINTNKVSSFLESSIKFKKNLMIPKLFYIKYILKRKIPYSKKKINKLIRPRFFDWITALLFLLRFYYKKIKFNNEN